ncbi:putative membrane protein [Candidatus Terasakiella magnetica]|uniref:Putative membrane protein n=1 Tax=Candidatus Terasakiella magnetica TaxID=1867952 RepID=A0A1C3RGV8_9PROT|nr:hypothetical protein [Candidatus Terasakiella magnetica]SCA56533.1 putative membrane protein [Candidatus Terasakiella magnetica]
MGSHANEYILIGILLLITAAGYLLVRRTKGTGTQKAEKILTGFLGGFILMGGSVKFFDPFTTMFASQIAQSELPFPILMKWAGQLGEMSTGALLLALLIFGARILPDLKEKAFYLANLGIVGIMVVAVYVHLHPNVQAEVLPFGSKPPVLTIVIMALAGMNIYLHRKNVTVA